MTEITPLPTEPYAGGWNLIYSTVRAFWALVEPRIHAAAKENNVPIELYYYGELGLDVFSVENFQKRDPYSNPAQFTDAFIRLAQAGWIVPQDAGEYLVTENARAAVREMVRAGDAHLENLEIMSVADVARLHDLLQRIVRANEMASEPPTKWATTHRFRTTDETSPRLAQVREALMDLFAYRDDSHRTAWQRFPADGLMWHTFGLLWENTADTPADMAQQASFRAYAAEDYARACNQLIALGWAARGEHPGTFILTPIGKKLRGAVEQLTDAYFYLAWTGLRRDEVDELLAKLRQLRERLEAVLLHGV
jgi:DNA-binding MarR family transcriptional regulator